mgnify:CR=1 FL=1
MSIVTSIATLEALYGTPSEAATVKEVGRITPEYRKLIEASPFAVLATGGPEGLDCSPRGDRPGFVRIHDDHTLMIPDRHGNNRVDSLRNIVRDPRTALLFLIPGLGTTLWVNGRAHLSIEPALLDSFVVEGKGRRGFAGGGRGTYHSLTVEPMADDADGKKRNAWYWTASRFADGLEDADAVGREAARRAAAAPCAVRTFWPSSGPPARPACRWSRWSGLGRFSDPHGKRDPG